VKESAITSGKSRDAIVETTQYGIEPRANDTRTILDRLPNRVLPPGAAGPPIGLNQWHNSGQLETWLGPNVFEKMDAFGNVVGGLKGGAGGLGQITEDENVHGGEAF
jgi:hypothetical protein